METTETSSAADKRFDEWVNNVRDPAETSNEGVRRISTGETFAEYRIAKLPSGLWAMDSSMAYRCGNGRGTGMPWSVFESREKCVEVFLKRARGMFGLELNCGSVSERQRVAQKEMLGLLEESLFGFVEPEPI